MQYAIYLAFHGHGLQLHYLVSKAASKQAEQHVSSIILPLAAEHSFPQSLEKLHFSKANI